MDLDAQKIVLNDFSDIWFTNCESRYRALKGARETGKSYNFIGIEPLFKLLSDKRRNVMMVRQNYKDNGDSTFTILKSCARKLGIAHLFDFTVSPYKIKRKDSGQVILFRGMNDVENITSTTVEVGYWTDIYFEEASQLKSYEDFRVVDGSLRIPNYENDLKAQITFCFNAWDVGHWLYDLFFKDRLEDNISELETVGYQFLQDDSFNIGYGYGCALHISSYKTNSFRSKEKDDSMAKLKEIAYDIYLVEGLGCWGNTADKTYKFKEDLVKNSIFINGISYNTITIGIDTGLSNGEGKIKYSKDNSKRLGSAMTMILNGVSQNWSKIVPIAEYFDSNLGRPNHEKKTEPQYLHEMLEKIKQWQSMYRLQGMTLCCYVDSADVGFRDELEALAPAHGLFNVRFISSTKIPILVRVQFTNLLMAFEDINISEDCKNLIREIKNARKSPEGKCREDFDDHAINAWEYAWIPLRMRIARWKDFKECI